MRIARIGLIFALSALGSAVQGAPAPGFASAADYMARCGSTAPNAECQAGFATAADWVRFNSDARLCTPDQKTSFGEKDYVAAVAGEIGAVIGWLKANPDAVSLDYVQSLGHGLVAVYACKAP